MQCSRRIPKPVLDKSRFRACGVACLVAAAAFGGLALGALFPRATHTPPQLPTASPVWGGNVTLVNTYRGTKTLTFLMPLQSPPPTGPPTVAYVQVDTGSSSLLLCPHVRIDASALNDPPLFQCNRYGSGESFMFGNLTSWPQLVHAGAGNTVEPFLTAYSQMYAIGKSYVVTESGLLPFCNVTDGIFGFGPPWGGSNMLQYSTSSCESNHSQARSQTFPSPWYNDFFEGRYPKRFSIAFANGTGLLRYGHQVTVPEDSATFEMIRPEWYFTRGLSGYYIRNASGRVFLIDTGFEATPGRLGTPIVDGMGRSQPFQEPGCDEDGRLCSPGTSQFSTTCVIFDLDHLRIHFTALEACM